MVCLVPTKLCGGRQSRAGSPNGEISDQQRTLSTWRGRGARVLRDDGFLGKADILPVVKSSGRLQHRWASAGYNAVMSAHPYRERRLQQQVRISLASDCL